MFFVFYFIFRISVRTLSPISLQSYRLIVGFYLEESDGFCKLFPYQLNEGVPHPVGVIFDAVRTKLQPLGSGGRWPMYKRPLTYNPRLLPLPFTENRWELKEGLHFVHTIVAVRSVWVVTYQLRGRRTDMVLFVSELSLPDSNSRPPRSLIYRYIGNDLFWEFNRPE